MKHAQLISRNQSELAEVFSTFQELNAHYDNQLVLSLDSLGFEIFCLRTGRPIIRHEFKHFRQLVTDMRILSNTITLVFSARIRINQGIRPKQYESFAIKRILKLYTLYDDYFFNEPMRNYIIYGKLNKEQNLADSY